MSDFAWPDGRRAAACLTYDDALPVHHQRVGPELEAAGLAGTFYTPIEAMFHGPIDPWRELAGRGHELGNHTIFHPCRRSLPDAHGWRNQAFNLTDYSADRFEREIAVANAILASIDGRTQRTYGNTCHNTQIGPPDAPEPIMPLLDRHFIAARGEHRGDAPIDPATCDPTNLGTTGGDHRSFVALRDVIEQTVEAGGLIIFCFHGVGEGTHKLFIETDEHRKLVEWLGGQRQTIWTAPLAEIAERLRAAERD